MQLKAGFTVEHVFVLTKIFAQNIWTARVNQTVQTQISLLLQILVLIAYVQKSRLNVHADVDGWARCLSCGLSHHLHPCFVYLSSEGSCQSVHLGRQARVSVCYPTIQMYSCACLFRVNMVDSQYEPAST